MIVPIGPKHTISYDGTNLQIFHANKGEGLPMHNHSYAHATICMNGSCKITQEGKELITNKHSIPVNLLAGKLHEIEALEDGTVFVNVFAEGKF